MNPKQEFIICLIIFLFLTLSKTVTAPVSNHIYTENNFNILLSADSSISFEHAETEINFTADTNWNGSSCSLVITSNGGLFIFSPENNTDITIKYSGVDTVKVNGTGINSGTQLSYSGQTIIQWNFVVTPLLPIMFIFGMIGLVCMFFGGLNFVDKMQKKDYVNAFIVSTIAVAIGLSFVLAWLWT